jgi:hypothetical protein
MKKLISIIVLCFLWSGNAFSDTNSESKYLYVNSNMSHEFTTCHSYYQLYVIVLEKNDPNNPGKISMMKTRDLAGEGVLLFGKKAGLSVKALLARNSREVDMMLKEIDNNFANIAVLVNKYEKSCKKLLTDPIPKVDYWNNLSLKKFP